MTEMHFDLSRFYSSFRIASLSSPFNMLEIHNTWKSIEEK